MHCIGPQKKGDTGRWGAFTVRPWIAQGKDPRSLANSYLVEYCNSDVNDKGGHGFGTTGGRGGFAVNTGFSGLVRRRVTSKTKS